ncbi:hypothetical protein [Bifidobacterium pseudolongum]|nr:hypothetical protein [Bifidobacterium pseudolongum]
MRLNQRLSDVWTGYGRQRNAYIDVSHIVVGNTREPSLFYSN